MHEITSVRAATIPYSTAAIQCAKQSGGECVFLAILPCLAFQMERGRSFRAEQTIAGKATIYTVEPVTMTVSGVMISHHVASETMERMLAG
jgi:hypothetical protein